MVWFIMANAPYPGVRRLPAESRQETMLSTVCIGNVAMGCPENCAVGGKRLTLENDLRWQAFLDLTPVRPGMFRQLLHRWLGLLVKGR